jgi:carbonic anhydrase/acetyltransferase-like protein (isoleucine patch superfamily)
MIRNFRGKAPKIAASAFVSEAAYIVGHVEIGENSSIWPGAVVRGDFGEIKIGQNTSLEDNCVVHSGADVNIGNDVIIGHGAVVHGRSIGNNVLVGNNATILDDTEIGDACVIGAGSVVTPGTKIPDKSLAMGSPARVKSRISSGEITRLKEGAALYAGLAREYKRQGL